MPFLIYGIIVILISVIVFQADKLNRLNKKVDQQFEDIKSVRSAFKELEKKLFKESDLEGWSIHSKISAIERDSDSIDVENLNYKKYTFGKTKGDIPFKIFFNFDKRKWTSLARIPRQTTGSLKVYLSQRKRLQKCIDITNHKIREVNFENLKKMVKTRDEIIDEMEYLVENNQDFFKKSSSREPNQELMETMVEIDKKIRYTVLRGEKLNKREILKAFKKRLDIE
ncbi:hypothetical protein [Fodinibius sp.]|uniref:hypothetical protein n=1 Tax=Fodinibius sp. TaxID=1872440 RepID=UPI002ACDB308|nr:hypothetical protein [Fodinibius sp.]MDZ7659472.1 hypothetical protein [Fodinibius sp.]